MPPHSVQTLLRGLSRQPTKPLSAALKGNASFASTPFSKLESFNHASRPGPRSHCCRPRPRRRCCRR